MLLSPGNSPRHISSEKTLVTAAETTQSSSSKSLPSNSNPRRKRSPEASMKTPTSQHSSGLSIATSSPISQSSAIVSTDSKRFAAAIPSTSSTPNLSIREAMVTEILVGKNDCVEGVRTFFGVNFYAPSVILTTGTFMSGNLCLQVERVNQLLMDSQKTYSSWGLKLIV